MIPIRDTIPCKSIPVVNNLLIGINVVVFLAGLSLAPQMERLIIIYGLMPARYTIPRLAQEFTWFQQIFAWFSFMFLHGGFWHLLGNMWSLYIFGDNIEDHLGALRYLAFYLCCGLASGLTHLILNAHSTIPTIGASGAVAGVMGAYFLLHPGSKILTLIPIFFIPWFIDIPAFIFLGLWFLLQFLNATASHASAGGIAWWAHVGGFIFGIIFLKMLENLPEFGLTWRIRKITSKKKSHRLQVVRMPKPDQDMDIRGTITISPHEALMGTRKIVNIVWGLQRRIYKVDVPPGIEHGKILRLRGQGKPAANGRQGDLLLQVIIQ